jgi:hypothetical protein
VNITDKDIEYIKKMFCRYKCTADKETMETNTYLEDIECPKCHKEFSGSYDVEIDFREDAACLICQIDNFIRELQDNNII